MAHHKSAIKRIRQNKVRYLRNKARRTRVRHLIKNVRTAISNGDIKEAQDSYKKMIPVIDQMAALRIIHKNTAARTKSRLNRQIHTLVQSEG